MAYEVFFSLVFGTTHFVFDQDDRGFVMQGALPGDVLSVPAKSVCVLSVGGVGCCIVA